VPYLDGNHPRRARCCEDEKAMHRGQSCPGNVLSAVAMTRQNFGAGLYAPLRVAVYEDENGTTFEYAKPSTLLAQFHDPKIDELSHSLDDRLAALLAAVAR
jgi:hypothetical protein